MTQHSGGFENGMKRLKSKVNAVTFANSEQLDARDQLWDMFHSNIMTDSEKERNMGLFIRSSMLARIFAVAEIYKEIVSLPGAIAEFGTWRGQNAVLCENFRAIFEPFNKQRKIFAFDTFEGYQTLKANDKMNHEDYKPGKFSTGANYADILTKLLGIHESINVMGNVKTGHRVVKGNVEKTLPAVFKTNPNLLFALALFDMNLEGPTSYAINEVVERAVPGCRLVFFQLQRDFLPGEGIAYRNTLLKSRAHSIKRSTLYPSMSIVTLA